MVNESLWLIITVCARVRACMRSCMRACDCIGRVVYVLSFWLKQLHNDIIHCICHLPHFLLLALLLSAGFWPQQLYNAFILCDVFHYTLLLLVAMVRGPAVPHNG